MAYKAKQRYRAKDGQVVPGVTTIIGTLGWSKGVLIRWANKLGLEGIDSTKYVDDKATIGTLGHKMVLSEFTRKAINEGDYTGNQIEQAKNCLKSYKEWRKSKTIEPILMEERMISENLRIGGTPDFYGKVDGLFELTDYKSGKAIYAEHIIQTATYAEMLKEKGHKVDRVRILSIPRSDDESFSEKILNDKQIKAGFQIFKHLLAIYNLKSAITNGN